MAFETFEDITRCLPHFIEQVYNTAGSSSLRPPRKAAMVTISCKSSSV